MTQFKALPPPKVTWSKSVLKEVAQAVTETLNTMQKDFEKTTRTWDTDVAFTTQKALKVTGDAIRGAVGTNNTIYGYVNGGTRPHIIRPRRAKSLRFQTGYRAKSKFRVLQSYQGGKFGAVAYAQVVRHPGTKPREFDYTIADMRQPDFEKNISAAIARGINNGE